MPYDFILFDFDGTLFDTSEGILTGIRLALENAGIFVESDRELHKFMGPPVVQALKEFYGMTEEEAQRTKKVYREYYAKEGVFLCKPIDGAEKCLQGLLKAGKTLAVATSKPEPFARSILERFGYLRYFAAVAGGNLDESRSKKSEVISAVLQELGITDLSRAVMVGDRKYDVLGAKEAGLGCIGLNTGFSEPCELENAGAIAVVHNYDELGQLLSFKK